MANRVLARLTNDECAEIDLPDGGLTISGSVGLGGRNFPADVRTIQASLNQVSPAQGGPNPKLDVDGIVGPLTRAAIAAFQQRQFGWSDGRVDPDNVTIRKLQALNDAANRVAGNNPSGAAPPVNAQRQAALALVYSTLPAALSMVQQALITVDFARHYVQGDLTVAKRTGADKFAIVDTYFNLGKLSRQKQLDALARIARIFTIMRNILGHPGQRLTPGTGIFQLDPQDQQNLYAYTYLGGFSRRDKRTGRPMMSKADNYQGPNLREDAIYICTGLDGMDADFVPYNTIHEMAHFVGPELGQADTIGDLSYRHKQGFYSLPTKEALRTADSYAMLAVAAGGKALTENSFIYMPPMIIRP
jgi:peptidoglycan hydrolase-like protein with peptidoglycan-binding domain